jgi:hypothetical protein
MTDAVISTLGGGAIGAAIKIGAGAFKLWHANRLEERKERIALVGKQIELKTLGPDPSDNFVSVTRRALAWGMCFTFCAVVLLWAAFPQTVISIPAGSSGWGFNLFIFNFSRDSSMAYSVSTGAIVYSMLPFIGMILMTYFTPDVSKIK